MKTGRDNGSFSNYPCAKKLFQIGNLENKRVILCLELMFMQKILVWIPEHIVDITDFSFKNEI